MSRWIQAFVSCALLGVGIGACASEDDSMYRSGVNRDVQFSDLTPQEKVTICTTQSAYVRAHVDTTALMRFLCAFTPAVLTAVDDAACETAMADCVNAFSLQIDVATNVQTDTPPECVTAPLNYQCQGTVGAYEDCVQSLADVQINLGTNWSCGKRQTYADGPLVGVNACDTVGPNCTAAAKPVLR